MQEHEARWFFQQLIIALDYAHRMNVVSRDIKLENTLLDGSRRPLLKICDFGYSKNTEKDSVPKSRVGTPGYTGASCCPPCLFAHCSISLRSLPLTPAHNYQIRRCRLWRGLLMLRSGLEEDATVA